MFLYTYQKYSEHNITVLGSSKDGLPCKGGVLEGESDSDISDKSHHPIAPIWDRECLGMVLRGSQWSSGTETDKQKGDRFGA